MLLSKQGEGVSQPLSVEDQSSVEKSACLKSLNILVHFECDGLEFSRRITISNYTFYIKIVSVIQSKVPDIQSYSMHFQCGKIWHKFNQGIEFDDLCLNEDDPEITIRALTMSSELQHLGNYCPIKLTMDCSYAVYK